MQESVKNQFSVINSLVTVITVTYNSSAYVRDAIESVLAQDYTNIEYIIIDDCSTDNTWQIINEYTDSRIRKFRNDSNIREYPNRNKGIELAKGEYLIFIDGDDLIYPHGVKFFLNMLSKFPQACMAIQKNYFNNILFPALLSSEEAITNHYFGDEDLLSSSFTSNFFRTKYLKSTGLLKINLISGDDEIRVRLASRFPILFVAGWVSWPRETPGQASAKKSIYAVIDEQIRYTKEIIKHNNSISSELKDDIALKMKNKIARFCLKAILKGRFSMAKNILLNAEMNWIDIIRFIKIKNIRKDILNHHTSTNPLKKGFLIV